MSASSRLVTGDGIAEIAKRNGEREQVLPGLLLFSFFFGRASVPCPSVKLSMAGRAPDRKTTPASAKQEWSIRWQLATRIRAKGQRNSDERGGSELLEL